MRISRWETLEDFHCPACGELVSTYIREENKKDLVIDHCLICDCDKLFKQKSFNRNLGLAIVIVGAILSFWTYGISLLVVGAVDFSLFRFLPLMAVCYGCDAEFRGFKIPSKFKDYNHLKAAHVKKQKTYPGAEEAAHE